MKKQQRSSETKAKIKQAAFKLFAQKGYSGTSVDEIMKEAGYTKATFYVHFEAKESVFLQIMHERMIGQQRKLIQYFSAQPGYELMNNIGESLEMMIQQTETEYWTPIYLEFIANANRSEEVKKHMSAMYREWREFLTEKFTEMQAAGGLKLMGDPALMASLVIAIFDGFNMQAHVDEQINTRSYIPTVLQLLGTHYE